MSILQKVTWQAMQKNRTRTWVTIVGVVLSAAMFMAIASIAVSSLDYLKRSVAAQTGDYHCRFLHMNEADLQKLSAHEEVTEIALKRTLGYYGAVVSGGFTANFTIASANDAYFRNMPVKVIEGRLPENSGELLLDDDTEGFLRSAGFETEIGSKLTIPVSDQPLGEESDREPAVVNQTYTVVGVAKSPAMLTSSVGHELLPGALFTYDDGAQGPMLFCDAFVKTSPVRASVKLVDNRYGNIRQYNEEYLRYFGVIDTPVNDLTVVIAIAAVLCGIILVGSVGLICNSFSVSVTERTKQFGLLSSIGATKKQLRRSVLFEALAISLAGIPAGLLLGYGGAVLAVWAFRSNIERVLQAGDPAWWVSMEPVFSLWALLAAVCIAAVSVFLSAWIPARRATKIPPLEAIRQTGDYQVGKKAPKAGGLTQRVLGLPGVLAKKYYKVGKKRHKATAVSLIISVSIFTATLSVTDLLLQGLISQAAYTNIDFSIAPADARDPQLLQQSFVEEAVLYNSTGHQSIILSQEMYSDEFLSCWDKLYRSSGKGGIREAKVTYLEDEAFLQLLRQAGVRDTAPYFDKENPMTLVVNLSGRSSYTDSQGKPATFLYSGLDVLKPDVTELTLFPAGYPTELNPFQEYGAFANNIVDAKGNQVIVFEERVPVYLPDGGQTYELSGRKAAFAMRGEQRDGAWGIAYYPYDMETATVQGEIAYFLAGESIDTLRIGARLDTVPFAVSQEGVYTLALVGALSVSEDPGEAWLALKINDYQAAKDYLDAHKIEYSDELESEMEMRRIIATVNGAVSFFVLVIVLICTANIFNTISTNITLRRRDFGMLQSLGMQRRQLRRMLALECVSLGLRALLWGLGIGLTVQITLFQVTKGLLYMQYRFPRQTVATAAAGVFALIVIATAYAFAKMKKDNPIEAVRQENL